MIRSRAFLGPLRGLLFFPILVASEIQGRPEPASPVGWWQFELPSFSLSLLLKISRDSLGVFTATERNSCFNDDDVPIRPFWCDGKNVRYDLDAGTSGVLQLALNDKGDKLEGFFKTADFEFPLAYKRVDPAAMKPAPALSYTVETGKPQDIRGFWGGKLKTDGGTEFDYGFRIGRAPDGMFHGRFDSFQSGRITHLLNQVSLTNNQVHIENSDIGLFFTGELSSDGDVIRGKLTDWLNAGDLVLRRLEKPVEPVLPIIRGDPGGVEGIWDGLMDPQRSDLRMRIRLGRR